MPRFSGSSSDCFSIQKKIQRARNLHQRHRDELLACPHVLDLLNALRRNIDATQQALHTLGIIEQCRQCDEEGGGSCCGAGIENKYDVVLLLINLFLGAPLPEERYDPNSCFFAGKHGCILRARHVLCVNYLCSKIEQTLPLDQIITIQRIAGDELDLAFMLHESLKARINSGTYVQSPLKRNNCSGHQFL